MTITTYTEHTRLPDPITATWVDATLHIPNLAAGQARSEDSGAAALPTEPVSIDALSPANAITTQAQGADATAVPPAEVAYPDLPVEHIFNRMLDFPLLPNDPGKPHRMTPADVKSIIDYYSSGDHDDDTGRLPTLLGCCERQGYKRSTFLRRVQQYDELSAYYQHAQKLRADILHDELIEDASDESRDLIDYYDIHKLKQQRPNTVAVKRDELKIRAKHMVMSVLNREKYAPETLVKQQHLHLHGGGDSNPLEQALSVADVDNLGVEDLFRRQAALRALPSPG